MRPCESTRAVNWLISQHAHLIPHTCNVHFQPCTANVAAYLSMRVPLKKTHKGTSACLTHTHTRVHAPAHTLVRALRLSSIVAESPPQQPCVRVALVYHMIDSSKRNCGYTNARAHPPTHPHTQSCYTPLLIM